MSKQIMIIVLSIIMFISVWVIVIVQFSAKPEIVPLEVTGAEEKYELERALPLPNTIKDGTIQEDVDNERDETLDHDAHVTSSIDDFLEVVDLEEVNDITEKKELLDLRLYDFSDISTPDGVPIEGILTKLDLD